MSGVSKCETERWCLSYFLHLSINSNHNSLVTQQEDVEVFQQLRVELHMFYISQIFHM